MDTEKKELLLKIKLIGDSGVGKSSIVTRLCGESFKEDIGPTIGVDYKNKLTEINNQPIKLVIWDTAGQERFRTVTTTYYKNSHGFCFVYDITHRESFENIKKWLNEANENSSGDNKVVMMLIANKVDLSYSRAVSKEESEAFAREYNMIHYQTSAKTNEGIDKAFESIATNILQTLGPKYSSPSPTMIKTTPQGTSMCNC